MRKLGMNRLNDIELMTLTEFHYKRYAQEYKEIDEEYQMHKTAFLIRNASATKNTGSDKKPKEEFVFKQFEDFFDYEKLLKSIDGVEPKKEPPNKLSPAQIALNHNNRKR